MARSLFHAHLQIAERSHRFRRMGQQVMGQQVRNAGIIFCKPCTSLRHYSDGGEQVHARLGSGDALAVLGRGWQGEAFSTPFRRALVYFHFRLQEDTRAAGSE